ncbi:hypothetical protein, partial [uncultured Xanthomonas sp.]|uniref:hypothetical protein n=1 Tax=uncultured Xanthomonas sp. TaxID=152831 RepID=UPI0025CBD73D
GSARSDSRISGVRSCTRTLIRPCLTPDDGPTRDADLRTLPGSSVTRRVVTPPVGTLASLHPAHSPPNLDDAATHRHHHAGESDDSATIAS